MDTTQSFTSVAERIDYVDSTLDVNNEWDNTTHRFTCGASGAGVYQFTNTLFVDNANGWVQIFCKKNGVTQRITATDLHSSWDAPAGTTLTIMSDEKMEFLDLSQAKSMLLNQKLETITGTISQSNQNQMSIPFRLHFEIPEKVIYKSILAKKENFNM